MLYYVSQPIKSIEIFLFTSSMMDVDHQFQATKYTLKGSHHVQKLPLFYLLVAGPFFPLHFFDELMMIQSSLNVIKKGGI